MSADYEWRQRDPGAFDTCDWCGSQAPLRDYEQPDGEVSLCRICAETNIGTRIKSNSGGVRPDTAKLMAQLGNHLKDSFEAFPPKPPPGEAYGEDDG